MNKVVKYDNLTENDFKIAAKEVLGAKRPSQTIYENRKPTKEELNRRWKLERR